MSIPISIESLLLTFDLPLQHRQISSWRGAFLEMAGIEENLMHNHLNENQVYYRYPLVQYRCHQGKAAIFALNQGINAVQSGLLQSEWQIRWGEQSKRLFLLDKKYHAPQNLELLAQPKTYLMHHYLALNQENYALWQSKSRLRDKAELLEKLLRNHLLSSLWSFGWSEEQPVEVRLQEIRKTQLLPYHGQRLMAFDLVFDTNVKLPEGIALGKAVSFGFGWAVPYTQSARRQHDVQVVNMPKQAEL